MTTFHLTIEMLYYNILIQVKQILIDELYLDLLLFQSLLLKVKRVEALMRYSSEEIEVFPF
jgi:hypothetical protein